MAPPYRQLCLDERETIHRLNEASMPVSKDNRLPRFEIERRQAK